MRRLVGGVLSLSAPLGEVLTILMHRRIDFQK